MNYFTNQVALITGAGSGIGRQLALDLAREGAAIAALDLKPEPLAALKEELAGKRVAWATADVTDRDGLGKAIVELQNQLGPIDLLIASAGIGIQTAALNYRGDDIEAVIRVNLIGVANSIAAVLPGMIDRRRGHIVGLSSMASYHGLPHMGAYCASKAGVNALLDALRVECQPLGIYCTTLCPGWIRTPMTAQVDYPMPHLMELPDACRLLLGAIRARKPFYAYPPKMARWLRLLSWLPASWGDRIVNRMLRRGSRKAKPNTGKR